MRDLGTETASYLSNKSCLWKLSSLKKFLRINLSIYLDSKFSIQIQTYYIIFLGTWHHWTCFQWNLSHKTFTDSIFLYLLFFSYCIPNRSSLYLFSFTSSRYFIYSLYLWQTILSYNYQLYISSSYLWSTQIK